MRTMKFRVWDKEEERYLDETQLAGITPDGKSILFIEDFDEVCSLDIEDIFIIEPSTGLKDKNGEEIYEGDICRLAYYTKKEGKKRWHKDYEDVEVAEFEDGYFKFSNTDQYGIDSELSFSDYGEWSTADGSYKYEAEVIGNIHENKELLGGE